MTDPQSPQPPQSPLTPGSQFLRRFYARAGIAYLLMAPLLGVFVAKTPMRCGSASCNPSFVDMIFAWTVLGAVVSLTIGILAFVKRETTPRWLTMMLMMFPFIFWLIYWLIGKAGGIM